MSALAKLKLSDIQKPTDLSPIQHLRMRMVEALEKQIQHANQYVATGGSYEPVETRTERNPETGELEEKRVKIRFSPWWFKDENGKLFVSLRYANKPLEIRPNKVSVEIEDENQLPDVLRSLQQAIATGELDKTLEVAAKARREQFAKIKAKKSANSKG